MLGDAVGLRFEGRPATRTWEAGRERLPGPDERGELTYSDDTQMALALAAHLAERSTVDQQALGALFCERYEPWRGYSTATQRVLAAIGQGTALSTATRIAFPDGSRGNGAAMRVAPVGLVFREPDARVTAAVAQAEVTHVHPEGVAGAVAVAEAVAAALAGLHGEALLAAAAGPARAGPLADRLRRAAELPADTPPPRVAETLGNGFTARDSVPAALWLAATRHDPEDLLVGALAIGGDADTIAAMACAVAGARWEPSAWPDHLVARLEDGPHGRSHAVALADRLDPR